MAWQNHPWRQGNKYKAKRSEFAGRSFASQLERDVYAMLLLMQKAGEIKEIQCQKQVTLIPGKHRVIYIPDFMVTAKDGEEYFVEAKGFVTPEFVLKKKIWGSGAGPGRLEIWVRSGTSVKINEIVIPEPSSRVCTRCQNTLDEPGV